MIVQENSIVFPLPTEEYITGREKKWRQTFPADYKKFLIKYNGGIPEQRSFLCNNHSYAITRFLCMLSEIENSKYAWCEISVVGSQIGERLTDNGDLLGYEVLPIAELFAGDYLCLDFREDKGKPSICVWNHEESGEFDPVTYKAANSFAEFLEMLH